ncbi:alpha/beta hydrolase [Alloalcanivorax profundimaris]|uniref:alpha/beta hydrolase n=1 Tax=Alloalcanivorax profundimaris TaxID=2735259 RepID=UPI001E5056BF|nr:alpha/beta hydrolase [Alloalcanivorax profundimaris]
MSTFVLSAALVLSACGGDSDSNDDFSEAPAPRTQPDPVTNTTAADAATMGDYAVAEEEYDFGRMTVYDNKNGDSYDTDIHGYIQYPQDADGPFPVVLFLHGRHGTCYDGWGIDDDDCANPIPSFRGYEYISENLASHGYAVISVDANDINDNDSGPSNGDTGGLARAMLVVRHLDEFRDINAAGGLGLDALMGKLDMSEIGIMGHSRGGEGVNQTVLYNRAQPEPHNITAVFSLAPTDYNTQTVSQVNFVALAGYCDGDVEDLMGNFAYDTSRYAVDNDPYPKFQLIPMGANHNYYNTVWTTDSRPDDWTILDSDGDDPWCGENAAGNGRDTPELQQAQGLFFIASFFRYFIGHESDFAAYWNGQTPVPGGICPDGQGPCDDRYLLSVHAPAADRLVIDDTLDPASLTTNNLGGSVWFDGFSSYGICQTNGRPGEGCDVATPTFNIAEQLFMAWDTSATYRSELLGLNATDYQVLSVRVGVSHGDADNESGQDFHVILEDRDGNRVEALASDYSDGLFYPPGRAFYDSNHGSQKTTLNAVDIPLTAFKGVDFTNLNAVELAFDETPAGTVQITDLVMQRVDF